MMPTNPLIVHTILTALVLPLAHVMAQDASPDESTWIGVVTTSAPIRCGANESYYSIASAEEGDFVVVQGKKQDWIRVGAEGPVFDGAVGYIKYPSNDDSVFALDGEYGVAKSEIEILAKNIDSDELYRSWRPVNRMQNGEKIELLQTVETEPGTLHREAYMVHTVALPKAATGWINSANITRATPEQTASFYGVEYTVAEESDSSQDSEIVESSTETDSVVEKSDVDSGNSEEVVVSGETKEVTLEPLSLVELEAAWNTISSEPVMGAEVFPLQDMYAELLANNEHDLVIQQIAGNRMKQLQVWAGLQEQRVRIEQLRANLAAGSNDVSEYREVMSMYGDYALAGVLALSNTFDGRLRPFMYRIQDPKSGRTLGYLPANEDWELPALVGQSVGIVGEMAWNPSWRVHIVDGSRIDILSPTTATVTPDIQ